MALLTTGTACERSDEPYRPPTVRDSSGVTIVESSAPRWSGGSQWRLSETPMIDIGVADGSPEYELFRVSSGVRLPDGRIAVANGAEIRFFDPRGSYIERFGRSGAGPGEFGVVSWIRRFRGDSIAVYDGQHNRISVLDSGGELGRIATLRPTMEVPRPSAIGILMSGQIVSRGGAGLGMLNEGQPLGKHRHRAPLLLHDPDGSNPRVIASFPGREVFYQEWKGNIAAGRPHFGHDAYFALTPNQIVVGITDSYQLALFSADGSPDKFARRPYEVRVTREDIDVLLAARLEVLEDPGMRRETEQYYADLPTGDLIPPFGWPAPALRGPTAAIHVDDVGSFWVVDRNRPGDERNSWTVFDQSGDWLGIIVLPDRFWPFDIGADYILGRWTDSMDVTHVRMYGLVRT